MSHPDFHPVTQRAPMTIILPHKRNPGNDAALRIALDCLFANTVNDFHLLIDAAENQPLYERIHRLMLQATTECVVYTTSDSFHAPGWDVPMLEAFAANRLVYGVVVEPGMIGVYNGNIHSDFGRKPEQFDRRAFEAWASYKPGLPDGYGFPAPIMYPRSLYLQYDYPLLDQPDFYPRDDMIIDRMLADGVVQQVRVPSYFFHLQRFSDAAEQQRPERD
jgi:hypothetical protein